jgi:molybdopterin-dependent oxidoreductase alpha subunit
MSENKENNLLPKAENPEALSEIKLSLPKKVAAGIPAILASAQHILYEMGPVRAYHALASLNQMDGYDCPGCAWPDPDDDRSQLGEYCENGVKAIAEEATSKILDKSFFEMNSVHQLSLLNDFEIGKKGRITQPVYLAKGDTHYRPITWENAFKKIAGHLHSCSTPDEAVFYTSGRTSNEAAFLYQLFVRQFGTNNLPDCSNMCHESSGVALTESLGIGKGSVTLEDFYKAEVIIILGQNPGTNHPRMLSALKKAKENGCVIVSINPLQETGLLAFNDPQSFKGSLGISTSLTDLFLQVKINGDMALLQAVEKLLFEEELKTPGRIFDSKFIEEHTEGFDAFINHIKELDINELSEASGISPEEIKVFTGILKTKSKIIACWAMGLTQHKNAVDTIKEIVNLLLLKGSIGKAGAGTCPVRGHSNVQGDRTMGIYEKPSESFLNSLEKCFGISMPRKHGYDTVDAIHAMKAGKVKVFVAMGGNFLSATPDTTYTAEGLKKCELTVYISTKLNRAHLITGTEALILPTLGRSDKDILKGEEQFVTTENSMGVVQMSKGVLKSLSGELLSEPVIITRLALEVFGKNSGKHWQAYLEHYNNIRTDISKVIPGFDNFNQRVRKPGGFYLPNSVREKSFSTGSGKASFTISNFIIQNLKEGEFMMMTIRSHDQFNTTIYGMNDRYRGVYNERRVIFMNQKDMLKSGLKKLDFVDLYNYHEGIERKAGTFRVIPYNIPEKCTATYFPETNVLVPITSTADKSNTPTSKLVIINIRKQQSIES